MCGLFAGVAALSLGGTKGALVVVGGGLALALLLVVVVVTAGRLSDLLAVAGVALMTVPLDTYLLFREHVGGWPGLRVSVADLALMALVPSVLLGVWAGRVRNVIPRPVLVLYALLLAQYALSAFGAADRVLASFEIASAVHALLVALVIGAVFRRRLLPPALLAMALLIVVHTVFAVAQTATGRPVGAEWFGGGTPIAETLETGVTRIRPSGLFDHPIVYADALLLSLPMFFAGLFVREGRLWRAAMSGAMVVALGGLALSLSRGAWISTIVAGVVLMAIVWRQRMLPRAELLRIAGGALLGAAVLAAVFARPVIERLTESNEGNLSVRFELNWIALSMVEAHPFAGVGLSNFLEVMDRYDPTNVMRRFPATVHNVYLLEAAEAGVPAAVLFVAMFAAVLWTGFRRLPSIDDAGSKWVAAAILAGLAGFLVTQLADFSHRLEPLRSLIWTDIGLLFALCARPPRRPSPEVASRG